MLPTRILAILASALLVIGCSDGGKTANADSPAVETLDFSVREGRIFNRFYRQGPVAAHLLLSDGGTARLIVAFPAGNSGVSLWFEPGAGATSWQAAQEITPLRVTDEAGRVLHGVGTEISAATGPLVVREAVLGSVRVIRNYMHGLPVPEAVASTGRIEGESLVWSRPRLDGTSAYDLRLDILDGAAMRGEDGKLRLVPNEDGMLRLRLAALTGDAPLTPIALADLLNDRAAEAPLSRRMLAFLSYEEKLLAGSWRFLTYFGRDTLLSTRLLLPALKAKAVEAALASVLNRLNAAGEVAHEEDIGEFALLRSLEESGAASLAPIHDYRMIDDNFMLLPVAAEYLLRHPEGMERAGQFLARRLPTGETVASALRRNIDFTLEVAGAFAEAPSAASLIALKPDSPVGEWRDSQEGLGHARIPYNVNAALVPAALAAADALLRAGLIDADGATDEADRAARLAAVWRERAAAFFAVEIDAAEARDAVIALAARYGIDPAPALESLPGDALRFNALALETDGAPLRVLQSDEGFRLLFGAPEPAALADIVTAVMRPFPAGLMTPAGLLVANPAYLADKERAALFGEGNYHGMVIWSWQQALLLAGFEHQLQRSDLAADLRTSIRDARARLIDGVKATEALRNSELWSWRVENGMIVPVPFGQESSHRTESNAAQLWSTVFLAYPAVFE